MRVSLPDEEYKSLPLDDSGHTIPPLLSINLSTHKSNRPEYDRMALHQFHHAQSSHNATGHATRAGPTDQQPYHYDFSAGGYGFPQPPKFDDKIEERHYLKGRLAAAFRIFGKRGFDEGVAGHITCRVRRDPAQR